MFPRTDPTPTGNSNSGRSRRTGRTPRHGVTLIELLVVSTLLAFMAGTLAALAMAVQVGNSQQYGRGLALQHGRVLIERVQEAIRGATASEQFPGFIVLAETVGGRVYPDTLVVWRPDGQAADPSGLPRVNELVIFTPDPESPNRLLEVRVAANTTQTPPVSQINLWLQGVDLARREEANIHAVVTDLLRVGAAVDGGGAVLGRRACLRFQADYRPTPNQWTQYRAGALNWDELAWPQGIHGNSTGLAQAQCLIEAQIRPADVEDNTALTALPFFGSAALIHELPR